MSVVREVDYLERGWLVSFVDLSTFLVGSSSSIYASWTVPRFTKEAGSIGIWLLAAEAPSPLNFDLNSVEVSAKAMQ